MSKRLDKAFKKSAVYDGFVKESQYLVTKYVVSTANGQPFTGERVGAEVRYLARALKLGGELTRNKYIAIGVACGVGVSCLGNKIYKKVKKNKEEA